MLIVAFILVAPGLTAYLPSSALAAIVIVAAAGLIDLRARVAGSRVDPVEALLVVAAFVGVGSSACCTGIAIAIGLSLVAS